MSAIDNVHPQEIQKFGAQAQRWWDPKGEFKTLHAVNPLRMQFIQSHYGPLIGQKIVDVGCGGGILSEALARAGARVLGIDLSEELLDVADLHGLESGVQLTYRKVSVETLAEEQPAGFDLVTCMEMLEHVPNPASVVKACAKLVKPAGKVFFSTLNRHPKAWLLAIAMAEHVIGMIPKGTHEFSSFIKPSELSRWGRESGLELIAMEGVTYHPLTEQFTLGQDLDVNYLAVFERTED